MKKSILLVLIFFNAFTVSCVSTNEMLKEYKYGLIEKRYNELHRSNNLYMYPAFTKNHSVHLGASAKHGTSVINLKIELVGTYSIESKNSLVIRLSNGREYRYSSNELMTEISQRTESYVGTQMMSNHSRKTFSVPIDVVRYMVADNMTKLFVLVSGNKYIQTQLSVPKLEHNSFLFNVKDYTRDRSAIVTIKHFLKSL